VALPLYEWVGLAQGEGVWVPHWLAVTLCVGDTLTLAHCEGVSVPLGDCVSVTLGLGHALGLGLPLAGGDGESGY
jgi:hypothetical protein